jgi:Txe/YoeB family toxin of Txe-Axe toxin-antitoxin module
MQFYYGDRMVHRVLDEAEFWKQQEAEHTVVIRKIVPNLESEFVCQLERFMLAFQKTKGKVVRYIETVVRSGWHICPSLEQEIRDLRETLARVKDFFTVIFKPEPTYLGEAIPLSGNGDLTND